MTGIPPSDRRRQRRSGGTAQNGAVVGTTYTVDIGGQQITVTVMPEGVVIEGTSVPASLTSVPDSPMRLLRIGDAVFELVTQPTERRGVYTVAIEGARLDVEALDERSRAVRSLRAATAGPTGPESIRAPMPGLVTRILVGVGDVVSAGARVVVMEAMKMENELRAKAVARVRRVAVEPGTAVEKGTLLVELEAVEAAAGGA
jgi:pyruvate carboxylase subunit B